jgi:hypothetical protein
VAAAAAGLLAVRPLAFAGDTHGKGHGHSHGGADVNSNQENSEGLIDVSDINANVPVNALNCDEVDLGLIPIDVKQITAPITGALALFGSVQTEQTTLTDNSCSTNQTSAAFAGPDTPAELDVLQKPAWSGALLFVVHDPKRRWRAA